VRRNTISAIWIGGLVLAAVLYIAGPDRFLARALDSLDALNDALRAIVATMGAQAYEVVHALALAMLVVFLALGLLASRRGIRSGWAMVVVSAAFLLLTWHPGEYGPVPIARWLGALVLALVGAVVMTRRLTGPPASPTPWMTQRFRADRP
jgi:hypothetical protein